MTKAAHEKAMKERIWGSHIPRVTGIWPLLQLFQCIVLPCCTTAPTRSVHGKGKGWGNKKI